MNRRIFTLLTAAAMLLTTAACGKPKTDAPKGSADPTADEFVWIADEQELPIPAIVDMPSMAGDTIYFFQNEADFSSSLYAYKLGDEEPAKLAFNTPWIYGFAALGDGTGWIAKSDQTMAMELCKVDLSTGDELEIVPFNTADGSLVTLIAMPGVKLGAYIMTMAGKRGIAPFIAQTGRFGDMLYELPLDVVTSECFSGNDLLVTTALTLDSVDNNSKERESLFNWLDGNLNYQAVSVLGANEDSVVCFSRTIRGGGANATLVTLSRVPASSVKEKAVLTLAVTGAMSDYLRGAVIDFNRASPDYKVEAITYDAGDTGLAGI
jgi:hypothetical protein